MILITDDKLNHFLDWLYDNKYKVIQFVNDHEMKEFSKKDILLEHVRFKKEQYDRQKKEFLEKGYLYCTCNCITPITARNYKEKSVQCSYCGGRHNL